MGHFAQLKAKGPAFLWSPLPESNITTTTTMAINTQIATLTLPAVKTCKRWGVPCPFCVQQVPPLHHRSLIGQTKIGTEIGKERERGEKDKRETTEGRKAEKQRERGVKRQLPPAPFMTQPTKKMPYPIVTLR